MALEHQYECLMTGSHRPLSALAQDSLAESDEVFFAAENQLFHAAVLAHVPAGTRHDAWRREVLGISISDTADRFDVRSIKPIQRAANIDNGAEVLHIAGRSFRAAVSVALDLVEEGSLVDLDSVFGVAQTKTVELDQRRPGSKVGEFLGYYSEERHGGNSLLRSLCQVGC